VYIYNCEETITCLNSCTNNLTYLYQQLTAYTKCQQQTEIQNKYDCQNEQKLHIWNNSYGYLFMYLFNYVGYLTIISVAQTV
jgi:hypothetical protein